MATMFAAARLQPHPHSSNTWLRAFVWDGLRDVVYPKRGYKVALNEIIAGLGGCYIHIDTNLEPNIWPP